MTHGKPHRAEFRALPVRFAGPRVDRLISEGLNGEYTSGPLPGVPNARIDCAPSCRSHVGKVRTGFGRSLILVAERRWLPGLRGRRYTDCRAADVASLCFGAAATPSDTWDPAMNPFRHRAAFAALAVVVALPVYAQTITNVPQGGMPSANEFSAQILPERADIVSWRTLAQVSPVKQGNKMVPQFSNDILALDKKDTKVQGFMIPLELGDKQKRFLLTAVPTHCSFCLPAGPDAIVEVVTKQPVRYSFEPIVVAGRFTVLKDDSMGLLYRLSDAVEVETAQLAPGSPASLVTGSTPGPNRTPAK